MTPGNTTSPQDRAVRRERPQRTGVTLGLRQNIAQFMLLVAVNALVGGTLGQERTVLPLLAGQVFHLDLYTSALTYILAFGLAKAGTNYFAGTLSDRHGRKPVLVAGWLIALPVPVMLIFGPSWGLDRRRQRDPGHQPGPDLVHHRGHENGSGRPVPARPGHGPERGRRLPRRRRHRPGHGLHRRELWVAAGTLPARRRLHRARTGPLGICCQGNPGARQARGLRPHGGACRRPRGTEQPGDLHPHQLPRQVPVLDQPGRPGQQSQRRPRLGTVSRSSLPPRD